MQKILVISDHHKFAMFDLIGLLPTNHIIAYIAMAQYTIAEFIYEETFDVNCKISQTMQNI